MSASNTTQELADEAAFVNSALTDTEWQLLDRFIGETFQNATSAFRILQRCR
jgi:hypothetical protein